MNKLTIATHEAKLALWAERIQECHESGMSVKDWCRSQGISDKTYYYWFRKLKQEAFDKLPEEQREKLFRKSRTVFSEVKKPVCISNSSDTAISVFKLFVSVLWKKKEPIESLVLGRRWLCTPL